MKLKTVSVKNFKGLLEATFDPNDFACLVGENNAGKSTVLQAIVYSLKRPTSLDTGLFYDSAKPVEFTLEFAGVTEAHLARLVETHREKVIPLVDQGRLKLLVRFSPHGGCDVLCLRLRPKDPRLYSDGLAEIFKGLKGAAVRDAFEREFPDWIEHLPEGANLTKAKEVVGELVAQLPRDELVEKEGPLPSGIPGSISQLLPEPIYIPAVKNLSDEIKTTQSTSFGRLLGLLIEDLEPDLANFNSALEELDRLLNRVEGGEGEVDQRHEKVKKLEKEVENHLSEHFSDSKVKLVIPPPELRTVFNSAQIWVDDGALDLIENKGDGIRRSLTFALLRAYVSRLEERRLLPEEEEAPRPLLFLFEEPELFLHPKSQILLFRMLQSISEDHQVVVTTHSPLFFSPGVTATFIRVAKQPGEPKPVGVLNKVDVRIDQPSAATFRLARFENADSAFFSSRVVLFEGESDDFFLKHVAKKTSADWDFERQNIALVKVNGKGNFTTFRDFFNGFGIGTRLVADLDALFDGFQHLGASPETVEIRNGVLQQLDRRLGDLGLVPNMPGRRVKKKVQAPGWRERYEEVRAVLTEFQEKNELPDDFDDTLDALFGWEQTDRRLQAVQEDQTSGEIIRPLLTALREEGICVLSRGAIEDYYPVGVPNPGSKPAYALAACDAIPDQAAALRLSAPLENPEKTEFQEVFERLFRISEPEE